MVLPDGSLFGEGVKTRLKEHLMEECNLHTILRLPNSVLVTRRGSLSSTSPSASSLALVAAISASTASGLGLAAAHGGW